MDKDTTKGEFATDSEVRYDRQIRLWGKHGQEALQSSRICLLNASATGSEIMKNLVLPGIGSFCIVDGKKVTMRDTGNNFFVTRESIGTSRAKTVCENLLEMNPLVKGSHLEEDPVALIEKNVDYFSSFSFVIAVGLPLASLRRLAKHLESKKIGLMSSYVNGFLSYTRIFAGTHTIIESKPENSMDDLRIDRPFPELLKLLEKYPLSSPKEIQDTPYGILLAVLIQRWKKEHGGNLPKTREEKKAFKATVAALHKSKKEMAPDSVEEAIKAAYKAYVPTKIPSSVAAILADARLDSLDATSPPFWLLVHALRDFVRGEGEGLLPLRGALPDMIASSANYIELQKLYFEAAARDRAALGRHLAALLERLGSKVEISDEELVRFCKNAAFLSVLDYRSLEAEMGSPRPQLLATLGPESSTVYYPLFLAAYGGFWAKHKALPGAAEDFEGDIPLLKAEVMALLGELGVEEAKRSAAISDEAIHEYCRFGGAELHNVAAVVGGLVSQEVIKVITRQFMPLKNSFIFNGINATSVTFEA